MQTFVFALVSYNKTKNWSSDVPAYLRTPMKSRGEIAYVLDSLPNGPPSDGTTCPYVFLEVSGIADGVAYQKLLQVLRGINETLVDIDEEGGRGWRTDYRCDARVDFTRLPPPVHVALLTPGNAASVTIEQFANACDLRSKGRELQPADLE